MIKLVTYLIRLNYEFSVEAGVWNALNFSKVVRTSVIKNKVILVEQTSFGAEVPAGRAL